MTNVRIGQWLAEGGAGQDGFYIHTIKGLFNGPGVRGESVPRPQAHGDHDVPVFRSPRIVVIEGPCIADSSERLDWQSNVFSGLLAEGQSGQVIFDMPGGPRWGNARLAVGTQPEFDVTLWGSRAEYQLQLKFANPRLFGESRTFASGVAAMHYGNFTAAPVITVTGSAPSGYTINGPAGRQYKVTAALGATPHVIDMADGYLRINGDVVSNAVTIADTWGIPSGTSSTITVTPVSGTASASQLVLDTFL